MATEKGSELVIEQPVPMRKQVYEYLRQQILYNTIEPSSRLIESQIAKKSGISRTPVREALHLLEKDGFIESIPRVGYRVKTLDWDELDEIFEIRHVNELLACRWAMRKIDDAHLKELQKNLEDAKRTIISQKKPDKFMPYDEAFHDKLFEASGSLHLMEICQQLRRLMLRYRAASVHTPETVREALAGHERILACITAKDETGLETAMTEHLRYSKEDIRRNIVPKTVDSSTSP